MLCRRFVQSYTWTRSFQKLLSTIENKEFATEENIENQSFKKISKIKCNSVSSEVHNQLKNTNLEYFERFLPKKILRKQATPRCNLYVINRDAAKSLSSIISQDLLENTSYVIECNPGLGLLTEELLNIGVSKITLFEKCTNFLIENSPIEHLFKKYNTKHNERLKLKQLNFFDIWMALLHDKINHENLADAYLLDAPSSSWKGKPFAQIIAICPSRYFISLLIHNFFRQTRIFDYGRPACYIVLPSQIWMRLTVDNTDPKKMRFYTHYNVLLYLFFDCKYLGDFPREAAIPWPSQKKNSKINELETPMSIIKMEPKANAYHLLEKKNLNGFWFFLKHCMRSRKNRVITEFEKFVPGCGPHLIKLDIDICTTFKELDPNKLLALFKLFRSWPEYDENLFTPSGVKIDETKKEEEEPEQEVPSTDAETLSPELEKKQD